MRKTVLPEFQDYLRAKSLVQEKYIPFYAHWASKFLAFSTSNRNLPFSLKTQKFTDYLRSQEKIADWQVRQAENAVTLYFHQFKKKQGTASTPASTLATANKSKSDIIEKMREAIRIKHYAYDTEIVYLDWARKFFQYYNECTRRGRKKRENVSAIS